MLEIGMRLYEARYDNSQKCIAIMWTKISKVTKFFMRLEDGKHGPIRMDKSEALRRFRTTKDDAVIYLAERYRAHAEELEKQMRKASNMAAFCDSENENRRIATMSDASHVHYTDQLDYIK